MRKPIALFLFGFVATASHAENRPGITPTPAALTEDVVPRSYLIHLEPNVETLVTDGVESIEIEVLKPTKRIVLNAWETRIARATIEIGDHAEELIPQVDSIQQTVSFDLPNLLLPGSFTLSIKFQSRIMEAPHGLVLRSYEGALGAVEQLLATELLTSDARRIFPCWDEPTFPARFQLSIKTARQNTVLSNTPALLEQPFGPDQKIVVFAETPLIASSTIFLASGKLEWLDDEASGVKLRIVTTSGKKASGKYAMEVTRQLLPFLGNYFGVPFPLSKLDQIALPSDADDARADCGQVIYEEDSLLCDPDTRYESVKQRIFLAVAYKIAYQWFGHLNMTTPRDDPWLYGGFASWMAKKAADHFNPQWKLWLHAGVEKDAAMAFDAGETTHAIETSLTGAEESMDGPDLIVSQKPWLLLRMLEGLSGDDLFRAGVRAYLAARQGSDTGSEALWASLERTTGKPIKKIVAGWIDQPGFPLIQITSQCVHGNRVISLEQVPFVLGQRNQTAEQWIVPVGIRPVVNSNEIKYALLDKLSNAFDLADCGAVIQANAGNLGYYRVLYEPALFNELQKNVEKLPESDRLNFLTDTWALVEGRSLPASSYFDLLEELRGDESFAVWQSILGTSETMGALRRIDRLEQGRPGRAAYQQYICSLFAPKFLKFGWDEIAGEDAETQGYRALLIETLGFFGDRDVIDESFKRFENYRENPSSLAPNFRSAVIAIVGRYSSRGVNHELLSMAGNAPGIEEKRMYLRALSATLDPELARENLQYFLSDKVKSGDASMALASFCGEGEHPDIAWSFATDHLKEMQERFGTLGLSRLLASIAAGFTDDKRADEVSAFVQANLPPTALRETGNSIKEIRFTSKLKAKTLPAIDDWIKAKIEGIPKSASRNP